MPVQRHCAGKVAVSIVMIQMLLSETHSGLCRLPCGGRIHYYAGLCAVGIKCNGTKVTIVKQRIDEHIVAGITRVFVSTCFSIATDGRIIGYKKRVGARTAVSNE